MRFPSTPATTSRLNVFCSIKLSSSPLYFASSCICCSRKKQYMKQSRLVDMISKKDTIPSEKMYLPAFVKVLPTACGNIIRLLASSCFSAARSLTIFTLSLKFSALRSASLWINLLSTFAKESLVLFIALERRGCFFSFFSEI